MKKLLAASFFILLSFAAFSQKDVERVFLYKSEGQYFVRVEIPYFNDLATPDNKIVVEVPGSKVRMESSLVDMSVRQTQNEYTDYIAVYDFPIGKDKLFRFKKLKCKVTFDYQQVEEFFTLEFDKFVWL